jgi:phage tail-like protein
MARTQIQDDLLSHEFHIIDVDIQPPFNPPFVLWPTVGFSSISPPEMTVETETISEGTSDYVYTVLKKASTSSITLSKGVSMFNADFWKWMAGAIAGKNESSLGLTTTASIIPPARRRNLLLLHSSGLSVEGIKEIIETGSFIDKARAVQLLPAAGVTALTSAAVSTLSQGVTDLNMLAVPGRAYMLFDCLPIRYRAAGEFDASTTAVSIEELELSYTRFELMGALGS